MFYYNQYVRAQSLDEAYELYQKKPNFVLGGMLWLKMKNKTLGTAIDMCDLGLDAIEEDENEFRIGAYVSLRQIETHEGLNAYTDGAIAESVRHIVGVQFRNVATVGGSIWGRFGFSDVMTVFRALGAKVRLHHAGIMDLDEFAQLPRTTRDILVEVIVPKKTESVVYLSQRNQSTDFPVLTCAVAERNGRFVAVIGASPYMAQPVWDEQGILAASDGQELANRQNHIDGQKLTNSQIYECADYGAEHRRFGSNMRAGAEYRKIICKVLVKRALKQACGKGNA